MWGEMLAFLVPMLQAATPDLQGIALAWLRKYRARIEAELPEIVQEINDAIASHDDRRVSALLKRLRTRARA